MRRGRGPLGASPLTAPSRPQCSGTNCRGRTTPTRPSRPPRSRRRTLPPPPPLPAGSAAALLSAAFAAAWGPAPAGAAAALPTAAPSTRRWTGGGGTGGPAGCSLPEVRVGAGGPFAAGFVGSQLWSHGALVARCWARNVAVAKPAVLVACPACSLAGPGPAGRGEKEVVSFCLVLGFVRQLFFFVDIFT